MMLQKKKKSIICHTLLLPPDYFILLYKGKTECPAKNLLTSLAQEFHLPVHAHVFCWQNIFTLAVKAPVALMSVLVEMLDCKSALNSAAPFDGLQRMSQQPGELGEKRDDGRAAA